MAGDYSSNPSASGGALGGEHLSLKASVGVQSGAGMNFGTLVWLAGVRMHLRVDSDLQPTERISLRVDLSPAAGTALLDATVTRVLPTAAGETSAYLLRLNDVASVDRPAWERFLRMKQTGGTLSDLSDVRSGGQVLATGYHSSSGVTRSNSVSGLPGTQSSASGVDGSGASRLAMRDALRSAIQRTSNNPTAAPAPRPPGPPVGLPVPTPTAAVALPGKPPPEATVSWVASNLGGRHYLEVRWLDAGAFQDDVQRQLLANVLTLTSDGRTLPVTPPIFMVLRFEGMVTQTNATPARQSPVEVTYQLALDDSQRATLRSAARSPSTVSVVPPPRRSS